MIEINLLPEDLRPKQVRYIIPPELLLIILLLAFSLPVIMHLFFGGRLLFKSLYYRSLNKQWTQLESQRQMADEWKEEHQIESQQSTQLRSLIDQRVTVSDKLQILSRSLPKGIWFNRLSLKPGEFHLEGSVISLKKDQMSLLNAFLGSLNQDNRFFNDFIRLELGRVNMRTLGGYPVMDFVVEGELK
ncbi:MAG: hypothetical protein PVI33_04585 [Candidatus Omnitrophota bacterium]|jgi:Tfp pilus assembly protein PilN